MFSHVMLGATNVDESVKFYDTILGVLGHEPRVMDDRERCFYRTASGIFVLTPLINGKLASHGNGATIGLMAESSEMTNVWHTAGVANGSTAVEGPPGYA